MQNNKMYGVSSWIWCGITPCWTVDEGGVDGARFEVALNNKLRWWRAMQSNPMNTKLPPFVPVRQCLTNVCQLECAPIPWPRPTNAPVVPPKNPVCLTPPKLRLPPTALEDGVGFLTFFRQEGLESNRRGRWGSASILRFWSVPVDKRLWRGFVEVHQGKSQQ